jgi:hypothetical protein
LEEKKKRLSKELEEMGRGNISKLLFLFFSSFLGTLKFR